VFLAAGLCIAGSAALALAAAFAGFAASRALLGITRG